MSKLIPLFGKHGEGKFAIVDDEDYEFLSQYKWFAFYPGRGNHVYARAIVNKKDFLMHKLLIKSPEGMVIDHIDGNSLNNQRKNLRVCSIADNVKNQKIRIDNKSGFKGVYWKKDKRKWEVTLQINGNKIFGGYYKNKIDAAKAYNFHALKYFGEFAKINIITGMSYEEMTTLPEINLNQSSSFRGVYYRQDIKKWSVSIYSKGKTYRLGCYDNEITAAKIYDEKAKELFGDKAKLNFK